MPYLNIFQLNKNTAVAVEKAGRIVAYKAGQFSRRECKPLIFPLGLIKFLE